ncbi:hypothetical protein PsorP6_000054 [Peronosclerospora sorghi]|uniref:Uncharacterized protein n=1 Tax=Peronosclerospora sorghi TaxID=230839 RepID=A0ACC0WVN9_9STRA|nr:hypothetical protein PsorP6_000054 [Peronosclerospora sorghi]
MTRRELSNATLELSEESCKNRALCEIDLTLNRNGGRILAADFPTLPRSRYVPPVQAESNSWNRLIMEELSYDQTMLCDEVNEAQLNSDQKAAYDAIIVAVAQK